MAVRRLNVGCGNDYLKGWINLDISSVVGADIVLDFQKGTLFRDNEFEEVLCNNMLTQIADGQKFVEVMNELWRITKGFLVVRVPLATHPCAFQDPMDCRRFTDQSFTYMEHGHRRYEQYGKHYGFRPWDVEILENNGVQIIVKLCPVKN